VTLSAMRKIPHYDPRWDISFIQFRAENGATFTRSIKSKYILDMRSRFQRLTGSSGGSRNLNREFACESPWITFCPKY